MEEERGGVCLPRAHRATKDGCPVGQAGAFAPPTLKGHPLMPVDTGQAKLESGRASLGAVWPPFPAAPYSLLPCPGFAPLPGAAGESGLKSPPQELWGPRGLQAGRPLRSVAITHSAVDAQGQQHDEEDHGPDG